MSETETMMAESVSKFAQEVVLPMVREMDEAEKMDPSLVEQLFEQGLMGIEIPEEYGGAGMNFTAGIVGIEELARVDPSVSVLVDVHNTLVNTAVLKYGTSESKRKWLPRLASQTVGSFCLSEPASGSDAFALRTKAEKSDSGYRINGSKMWITNSMEADIFIVFANLDFSKGYKGITAFVVEKGTKGFSIAKKEKKLGIRASSTCVINFDDVEIPKNHLLGEEGQGYKYAIGLLNEGRIGIAAQMTGLALGAWENAARYFLSAPVPSNSLSLSLSFLIRKHKKIKLTKKSTQIRVERPPTIRCPRRVLSRDATPTRSSLHGNSCGACPRVQCLAQKRSRRRFCPRRSDGETIRITSGGTS